MTPNKMKSSRSVVAGILVASVNSTPTPIFKHSWDTVSDIMGMHGKFKDMPSDNVLGFVADHYKMATIGTGCSNPNMTMEDASIAAALKIKHANPNVTVGMYYRSDMASELAKCSNSMDKWNANKEWWLKDDKGNVVVDHGGSHMMDYSQKACADFFAETYLYVLNKELPSGKPIVDYIYMDGAGCSKTEYAAGIGPTRSDAICSGKMNMIAQLQEQLNQVGKGQNLLLNGMDTIESAQLFIPTGAAGAMFDHWSILQYLNRSTGDFLLDEMDGAISFAQNPYLSNITLQVKGWPGPIIHQRDMYPPTVPQPKTPADFQKVITDRFNNELAMFLLVAEESYFWLYSWFWGFDDWVPGQSDSTIPATFFPQASCKLGAPKGKGARVPITYTYTREFEYASVLVDLTDRTKCTVTYHEC